MNITRLGQHKITGYVGAAGNYQPLLSIRGKNIVRVVNLCVFNTHAAQTLTWMLGIRRDGGAHRHFHKAAQAATTILSIDKALYLADTDELGITVYGSGATTTYEVVFQTLDFGPDLP